MLLVSLILAVVGLVALVAAVITNNEMIAWVCIGASSLGVILLIVDAIRERTVRPPSGALTASDDAEYSTDADFSTDVVEADAEYSTDVVEADAEYSTDDVEADAEYSTDVVETDVFESDVVETDFFETDVVETEDHPEELVHDEPEYDMPDDDEPYDQWTAVRRTRRAVRDARHRRATRTRPVTIAGAV